MYNNLEKNKNSTKIRFQKSKNAHCETKGTKHKFAKLQ